MDNNKMVDKCAVSGVARDITSMAFLIQDIIEEFFSYDTKNNQYEILWEYERARAVAEAINALILDAQSDLERLDIRAY